LNVDVCAIIGEEIVSRVGHRDGAVGGCQKPVSASSWSEGESRIPRTRQSRPEDVALMHSQDSALELRTIELSPSERDRLSVAIRSVADGIDITKIALQVKQEL
jgi:hypothetical protein